MVPVCILVPTGTYIDTLKLSSDKCDLNNVSVFNVPKRNLKNFSQLQLIS